jgi:hypothetical protein
MSSSILAWIGIVGAVDHDLEAVLDQRFGRLQRFRHVREKIGRVAEHFQLAQRMAVEQFARQAQVRTASSAV